MASRREFLQAGIATAGLVSARNFAPRHAAIACFGEVIVDERFPAGSEFAVEAQKRGLPVHWIRGDITQLWFHHLDLRWKEAPTAIAGLTQESSLFCLELLARDRGMRVVYRVEHCASSGGSLQPATASLWNWSRQPSAKSLETNPPRLTDDPKRLFSWIIAPKLPRQSQETS